MRRALTTAPGRIEIRVGDAPQPAPAEVVVEVEVVGICGSDLHVWTGHHPYFRYPGVQGHEFGGRIVELGADARAEGRLAIGDRVAVEPLLPCGVCIACRRGRTNCCVALEVLGAHVDGALADRIAVRASSCHLVDGLDAELTALVEPISIGLQAVARSGIAPGDRALVFGAGPIGLAIVLGATDLGAEVLVVDRLSSRLELASAFGAVQVVDSSKVDIATAVHDWTEGEGPVVVFEATGVPLLIRAAADLVAASGTVVIVGLSEEEVSLPILDFTRKELTIVGSRNNAGLFGAAIELVGRRKAVVAGLISHRFPFERAAEAMTLALDHPADVGKVLIQVNEA